MIRVSGCITPVYLRCCAAYLSVAWRDEDEEEYDDDDDDLGDDDEDDGDEDEHDDDDEEDDAALRGFMASVSNGEFVPRYSTGSFSPAAFSTAAASLCLRPVLWFLCSRTAPKHAPSRDQPGHLQRKIPEEKTLEPHLHSRTLTTCHDYLASVEAPTKSRKEARDTPHIRPGTLHTAGVALGGQHRRLVRVPRHQRRSTCGIIGLLGRGGGLAFREPKLRRHHSIVVKLPWGRHGQTITQHSRVAVLSLQDWDDLLWFSLFGVTLAMRARASDIFGFWYLTLPLGFAAVGSQRPVAAVVAGGK